MKNLVGGRPDFLGLLKGGQVFFSGPKGEFFEGQRGGPNFFLKIFCTFGVIPS